MKLKTLFIIMTFIPILLGGCSQAQEIATRMPTLLPTNTVTSTPTSTVTPTPTATNTPIPTPTPQTLGRIFPEGFHGQAVWSNAGGNSFRNYVDTGWFCPPPNYESTQCSDHVIHFDLSVPDGFTSKDPVLSPVDGKVSEIYSVGDGEFSIIIKPAPPFAGVESLLDNRERIDILAKGVFSFDYDVKDVVSLSLHLAHVVPLVKSGDNVVRGQSIANVFWNPRDNHKRMAFVIYIHMRDGTLWQFSPCDVPNEDEFCGKCTPGTIYPCP